MEIDQMPVMCPRRRPRSTRVPKELRPNSLFPPAPHITPLLSLASNGALREAKLTLKHLFDLRLATCHFTITPSVLSRKQPVQPYPFPPPQALLHNHVSRAHLIRQVPHQASQLCVIVAP